LNVYGKQLISLKGYVLSLSTLATGNSCAFLVSLVVSLPFIVLLLKRATLCIEHVPIFLPNI
jgi:hypothetical protein